MSTHGEPLGVVRLGRREEGIERVVDRDGEAGQVCQELAAEVKDDEKEVQADEADDGVGLGHVGGALEVVENRVFRQLRYVSNNTLLPYKSSQRHIADDRNDSPPCPAG